MRRFAVAAAALVGALGAALVLGRSEPLALTLTAPSAPADLYAIDYSVDGGRLVRFDPRTLRALPGPSVRVFDDTAGWSFSRDRRRLALGGESGRIRLVDTVRMRQVGRVDTGVDGGVLATHWVSGRRLLTLADRTLVVVDPAAGRVLRRTELGRWPVALSRTEDGLVLLLCPPRGIGDSTLAVVDAEGAVRSVELPGIRSGAEEIDHEQSGLYHQATPGLAVDEAGRRAFVIAADAPVAEIDLGTLAVELHALSRPVSVLGRLLDWLEPTAEAKGAAVGPRRQARWLGDGIVAVWGTDDDGELDARGVGQQHQEPAGLQLVDTRNWTVRTLDHGASEAAFADGLVLASASLWDSAAQRARGMGLAAYGSDGARRFHLLGTAPLWDVAVLGDLAVAARVEDRGRVAYEVIDLRRGSVTATVRPRISFMLLHGRAPRWYG